METELGVAGGNEYNSVRVVCLKSERTSTQTATTPAGPCSAGSNEDVHLTQSINVDLDRRRIRPCAPVVPEIPVTNRVIHVIADEGHTFGANVPYVESDVGWRVDDIVLQQKALFSRDRTDRARRPRYYAGNNYVGISKGQRCKRGVC